MAESDLELKVHELCLKRGWKMETVSNLPPDAIERAYNKLKREEMIKAIYEAKEKAQAKAAQIEEDNSAMPIWLTQEELDAMYPQEDGIHSNVPDYAKLDNFLGATGPSEDDGYSKGPKRK